MAPPASHCCCSCGLRTSAQLPGTPGLPARAPQAVSQRGVEEGRGRRQGRAAACSQGCGSVEMPNCRLKAKQQRSSLLTLKAGFGEEKNHPLDDFSKHTGSPQLLEHELRGRIPSARANWKVSILGGGRGFASLQPRTRCEGTLPEVARAAQHAGTRHQGRSTVPAPSQ